MKVPQIKRGDPLTAVYFNQIADTVNQLETLAKARAAALESSTATATGGTNVTPFNLRLVNALLVDLNELGIEGIRTQDEVDPPPELNFIEIARTTSTVRVEDPDDADTFVDVDRIDGVSFTGENNETLRLVFVNG